MWFTNKPQNSVHFVKIQWLKKEVEKHFFSMDWEPVEDSTFEGRLIKISPDEYEYEGTMRQTIKFLFIDDAHEYYQLDISYNNLSRSLVNTLLGYVDNMKEQKLSHSKIILELSLYINKENFKQMWIKINGERGKWRWDYETQKTMIETIVKKNGTKENDYFEYDEKLKSCIPEIQSFIEVTDFVEEPKRKEPLPEEPPHEELTINDIPF